MVHAHDARAIPAPRSPAPPGQPALLCVCAATDPHGEHQRWGDDQSATGGNGERSMAKRLFQG